MRERTRSDYARPVTQSRPVFVHTALFGGEGTVTVASALAESGPFTAVLACELAPSGRVGAHQQQEFPEIILGSDGEGTATVDGVPLPLNPGDAVYLPLGAVLTLENRSAARPLRYFIVKARG